MENVDIMDSLRQEKNAREQQFVDSMKAENQEFWIEAPDPNSAVDLVYKIGLDLSDFQVKSREQKDSLNLVAKRMTIHTFEKLMSDEMKEHIKEVRFSFGNIQYDRNIHFVPIITFSKDSLVIWSN